MLCLNGENLDVTKNLLESIINQPSKGICKGPYTSQSNGCNYTPVCDFIFMEGKYAMLYNFSLLLKS